MCVQYEHFNFSMAKQEEQNQKFTCRQKIYDIMGTSKGPSN
jgi:hypothetical protein